MKSGNHTAPVIGAMAFAVMVGGSMLIPALRALFAEQHRSEAASHAFMSVNMLGAMIGAPAIAMWADRRGGHRFVCAALALVDAALLLAFTRALPTSLLLPLRVVQGAANVGVLSIVLGAIGRSHGHERAGRDAIGFAGGAVMFAVALGPAIGGAALRFGPRAPFYAAAALAVMVAAAALGVPSAFSRTSSGRAAPRRGFRELARTEAFVAPTVLAFAERFTVGCFVVTFALYAHEVRHLSDGQTSMHYSAMLLPFALATYPFARDTARFSRGALVTLGAVLYGVAFVAFGFASGAALVAALGLAGLASAMVYGPSLCWVATAGGRSGRATSMALFHAAGCMGMLLGPAVAGVLSALMRRADVTSAHRYGAIFAFAGLVQLACVFAIRKPLARLRASDSNDTSPQSISDQREGSRS